MTDLEQALIAVVEEEQGCKEIFLITEVIKKLHNEKKNIPSSDEIIKTLNDLVIKKELIEITYILESMPYKLKSFYFPKGTIIKGI